MAIDLSKPEAAAEVAALESKVAALEKAQSVADSRVAELTADAGKAKAAKEALVSMHRASALSGIIDPELVNLAPVLVLDDAFKPTEDSLKKLTEWKQSKPQFFTPATPAEVKKAEEKKPSTPVVDRSSTEMTQEAWDKLRKENKIEFERRYSDYLKWHQSKSAPAQ